MENTFCQMLPEQYHAYRTLIGKPVKISRTKPLDEKQRRKEQLWDRFAFHEFLYHAQIHNSHYFIWFPVVNEAASYGGTWSHIATHFGYSTSQSTLLRKLNSLFPYSGLVLKTTTTLGRHKNFIIVVFDNSQVNIPKTFQRFGSCANMAIATCRLFAEPSTRDYIKTVVEHDKSIGITYIDQAIPSPYGMP